MSDDVLIKLDMPSLKALHHEGYSWYVLAVTEKDGVIDVIHMVGYPEKPTSDDLMMLRDELANDEELGLGGLTYDVDYTFIMTSYDKMHGAGIL